MSTDWIGLLPILILSGGGTVIFGVGAFWRRRPTDLLFALALLTTAAAGAVALLVTPGAATADHMVDLGAFARFFTFLFMAIMGLTLLFVRQYGKASKIAGDELYALLLFAALGMILVAAALNWVIFFLGLELLSLALYVLIAIRKGEALSNEAGLKYFIMGAVASGFLTFGIALLYAMSGSMQIAESLAAASSYPSHTPVIIAALALLLVGIGFKISIVPFHLWAPDVYQGAPAPVTAFLATGSKVALFAALLRFSLLLADPVWADARPLFWVLAVATMVVGNLTALYQSQVKRLLAYSSVAQMGYLLMTLVAVRQGGLPALMFYLAVYAVMDLGAFGMVATFSDGKADRDDLSDYQGLGYSHPWRAAILATCLISLAGLPPTAGFMGKLVLFRAVLDVHYYVLAAIGMFTVLISIYFYMKVVVALYMSPATATAAIPATDLGGHLAGAIILSVILWLGLIPGPLFTLIADLVAALPKLT